MLEPKQSPFWWTRNAASTIYFLRELTGVVIALYVIVFVTSAWWMIAANGMPLPGIDGIFTILLPLTLIAAIFHALTWFWVTLKLFPMPLPPQLQLLGFLGLMAVWLAVSYFLLNFFYIIPSPL